MKKLLLMVAVLVLTAVMIQAATVEVSQPVQVTSNGYYERGQAIRYGGGYYWLFYGRSATVMGNYGNDNPDVSDYQIYFKKATSVEALDTATATAISAATNCYLGEIGAAYFGGKVWTFATVPSTNYPNRRSLYGWYSADGTSWTEVADIADDLPDGAAHHDEITSHSKIYITVNRGATTNGWSYLYSATPETGGWSVEQTIAVPGNGLAHFLIDTDDSLYLAMLTTIGGATNRILEYDGTADSWTELGNASSSGWDPTLFKVGSEYVFAQAPWSSGRQWVIAWYGTDLSTLLSGPSKMVSEGRYGSNVWVEMWPIGFTDEVGNSYLFYTSERNPDNPSSETTGNIWYLKVDWGTTKGLADDHYTYIQEAIDGATSGDVIEVAAGTYEEQIKIDGKSLDLVGAGIGFSIIEAVAPSDRTTYNVTQWTGSSRTIDACIGVVGPATVNISGFTIDGKKLGPNNFYGLHFFDCNGSVTDCRIANITDSTLPSNSRVASLVATHSASGSFNVNFSNNVIPNFQKGAILIMGPNGSCILDSNIVDGAVNPSLAPNGIQVSYGAIGTLTDNNVSGVAYSGQDWGATGILLFESEDVTVSGGDVTSCQMGVNYSSWNWVYDSPGAPKIIVDGVNFQNNEWSTSIHLGDDGSDLDLTVQNCTINNSTYSGVDLYGSDQDPWGGSYYGGWKNGTLTAGIYDNTITNCDVGLQEVVVFIDSNNTVNCTANRNDFSGSVSFGVSNDFTNMLDAEQNWWGDASGPSVAKSSGRSQMNKRLAVPFPATDESSVEGATILVETSTAPGGTGAGVSSNVDYSPWWGGNYVGDPHTTSWAWYVDTSNSSTIQEGVDAASAGDVVNATAATYEEQVVIGKELTLSGAATDSTVIRSPVTLTEFFTTSANNYPIVYVHDSNVVIEQLTVNGLGRGNANYRFVGIAFWNAGGSVSNVHLTGVRDTPFSGSQHGVSIYAYNNTGGPYTLDITNVTIDDMQKTGMALNGNGLTANVTNCTVTGQGPTSITAQNGIQIAYGAGGTATGDTVSGIGYTGGGWVASAMLFYNAAPVSLSGSVIFGSQVAVLCQETQGTIDSTTITSTTISDAEGISIRDYGSVRILTAGLPLKPVSPFEEDNANVAGLRAVPTNVAIDNVVLTGVHETGSYGIAAWAIGDNVNVNITNSEVGLFETGIVAWEEGGNAVAVVANDNLIIDNGSGGAWTNAALAQDFENNNWGASDGPEDLNGTDEVSIGQCYSVDSMKNTVAEYFPGEGLGNGVTDNIDYCPWIPWSCCVNRGNVDRIIGVGGAIDVADLTYLVSYLFQNGSSPPCKEEGNVDGIIGVAGPIDVADLTYLVAYLFQSGPTPPPCP